MKPPVAILAGGLGTRLSEETILKPKPMVEIGGRPILWHIMKIYKHYGFNVFVIAEGYKKEVIEEYFAKNIDDPDMCGTAVVFKDTGLDTQISGRVRRILEYTQSTTMLTYGDGLANIDIGELLLFHQRQGKMATITAVHPPSRFGRIKFADDGVTIRSFDEKPLEDDMYINGGFMVLEPEILKIGPFKDDEIFERVYLPKLSRMRELVGYCHPGFWQCMDTIREKQMLNELWDKGNAPWKVWNG